DMSDAAFEAFKPVQWPARAGPSSGTTRFFAEGGFYTPERKARLMAPERPQLSAPVTRRFPVRLNTGRVRDQWHTMTRRCLSARLATHAPEPFVEVNPDDAEALGLVHGRFARVQSGHGTCVLKVVVTEDQQRGSLFAPIHWSAATASSARVGELVMS